MQFSFKRIIVLSLMLLSALLLQSAAYTGRLAAYERTQDLMGEQPAGFEQWLSNENARSIKGLLANISRTDTRRGVVVASPSKSHPDYYYHWVRDASLVMAVVMDLYEHSGVASKRSQYRTMLGDFIDFSRLNQTTDNPSGGPGEPKFNVDGSAYNAPWGRPQNDGPALRAITLIRLAKNLLKTPGNSDYVRTKLYDSKLPTQSVIKADLEFVASHWRDTSFDLWEEVKGAHFYTRLVQRRALLDGADLASQLGDDKAADWYRQQAGQLQSEISGHWDQSKEYLVATLNRDGGINYKNSGLDIGVILAILHTDRGDDFFAPTDERVLATAQRMREAFAGLYEVNKRQPAMAPAIGRYPEDRYTGYSSDGPGNPWFIATNAMAEFYYKVGAQWNKAEQIEITATNLAFFNALQRNNVDDSEDFKPGQLLVRGSTEFNQLVAAAFKEGDLFMQRVKYHIGKDGAIAEQLNRDTGVQQGAQDLTWSYASFITAMQARDELCRTNLF